MVSDVAFVHVVWHQQACKGLKCFCLQWLYFVECLERTAWDSVVNLAQTAVDEKKVASKFAEMETSKAAVLEEMQKEGLQKSPLAFARAVDAIAPWSELEDSLEAIIDEDSPPPETMGVST